MTLLLALLLAAVVHLATLSKSVIKSWFCATTAQSHGELSLMLRMLGSAPLRRSRLTMPRLFFQTAMWSGVSRFVLSALASAPPARNIARILSMSGTYGMRAR